VNGIAYQLPPLALNTDAIAGGALPIPTTQEIEHPEAKLTSTGRRESKDGKSSHSLNLADSVKMAQPAMFPTPTARDYKGGYRTESLTRKDGKSRAVDALPNAVLGGKGVETATGQLNPAWVCWLMGYPLDYLDLGGYQNPELKGLPQEYLTEPKS